MSSILIHGLFHHMDYSRLLPLIICNLPLQEQDTWLNTLTCYLICSFTEYIYDCFRIIHPYPSGKEHYRWSTMLMCSSFCLWFYRFYLLPKLLRSAPSPIPFSEVVSYICNGVHISSHKLHSFLGSWNFQNIFSYTEVYSLCSNVVWVSINV